MKSIWSKQLGNETRNSLEMFQIISLEILKRRNKRKEPCTVESDNFDQLILKSHLEKIGCRAPYISHYPDFTICNTKAGIKKAYFNGWALQKYYANSPCQEMTTIDYYSDNTAVRSNRKTYAIWVSYPFKGKIITQLREVDAQTLVGNIGGYIGLFLGKPLFSFNTTLCRFYEIILNSIHFISKKPCLFI